VRRIALKAPPRNDRGGARGGHRSRLRFHLATNFLQQAVHDLREVEIPDGSTYFADMAFIPYADAAMTLPG